jgi:hypothetical protein
VAAAMTDAGCHLTKGVQMHANGRTGEAVGADLFDSWHSRQVLPGLSSPEEAPNPSPVRY